MAARNSSRGKRRSGRLRGNRPQRPTAPRSVQSTLLVPPAIELAIDEQQSSLETAISLLYCLHSALRREIDDVGRTESQAVEDASEEANLTDITEMLLVRLNSIHIALDPMELARAKVDPETVRSAEEAHERVSSNEREAS